MEERVQPINFSWQNPVLRETIYPFRKKKLLEFILACEEVDQLKEARAKGEVDPAVIQKMQEMRELLQDENRRIAADLQKALATRMEHDKWLPQIKDIDEKKLRNKRIYYFDRLIVDWTDRLADRQGLRDSLLKRAQWYIEGTPPHQRWLVRVTDANKLVDEATTELDELKKIRALYERQDKLPKFTANGLMTVEMMVRWELLNRRNELDKLSHSQLVVMIEERFDADPNAEKYRPWLRYMVFHFSGMRYKSAHGSWAEPKFMLAMLSRELMENQVREMSEPEIIEACDQAIAHLGAIRADTTSTKKIGELDRQISQLKLFNRPKALLAYLTDLELARIENFNDKQVLDRLEELHQIHPVEPPPWFWQEVEKFTPLKLKTQDKDWESIDPERWDFDERRWREILDIWERQDITGWRAKHRNTLDMIVTRAVCNEIAEHIQHLRGRNPGAGLTAKPRFYNGKARETRKLAEGDPQKAYFKYPKKAEDFQTGASILWMGIVTNQPNPWQIVESIPGFDFATDQGGESFLRWTHEATVVSVEDMLDGKYVLTFETGEIGLIRRHISTLVNNPNVLVGFVPEIPLDDTKASNLKDMIRREKILQLE